MLLLHNLAAQKKFIIFTFTSMEVLSVELNSPSPSSFDINLVSLIEPVDDMTTHDFSFQGFHSSSSSPNILSTPCSEVPVFPPIENLEQDSNHFVSLLQQRTSPSQLNPVVPNSFGGQLNQLLETDIQVQLPSTNTEALENYVSNEVGNSPNDLAAIVYAALQESGKAECPAVFTPIPRVLQPAPAAPPSLNLNAIITPRHMFASPFTQPLSVPFSATNSSKRRYYGSASSSRYCHICGRGTSSAATAKCSNSRNGTCRKIICERCMLIHDPLHANVRNRNEHTWVCTHCRMKCPACARCHQYARNNMKRRLRNQAGADKGIKKRNHDSSKAGTSGTASMSVSNDDGIAMDVEKTSDTSVRENVSHGISYDIVDSFFVAI